MNNPSKILSGGQLLSGKKKKTLPNEPLVSIITTVLNGEKYIEETILKKLDIKDKTPQYKIYEQIKNGNIKIFNNIGNKSICSFILKISGIWETNSNYGLTYKFVKVEQ